MVFLGFSYGFPRVFLECSQVFQGFFEVFSQVSLVGII